MVIPEKILGARLFTFRDMVPNTSLKKTSPVFPAQ